jgi:hypothetical protein
LKPEIKVGQWNEDWTELCKLFETNSYNYREIYENLHMVFPIVLEHKREDIYVDGEGIEYQLESLRLSENCPKTITPVSIYSFMITYTKGKGGASNVIRNIVSLGF